MLIVGLTALGSEATAVRGGVALVLISAIFVGFAVLRLPTSLGPLDSIRNLSIFAAARTTPASRLLGLGSLRVIFALVFVSLIGLCCAAFGLEVPVLFLLAGVPILIVVAMIPSVAGLGTGQVAFVEVFGRYGDDETLLACSLAFSTGLIVLRAAMGLVFAREFTREALVAVREAREEENVAAVREAEGT